MPPETILPNLEDKRVAKNMGAREREMKIKIRGGGGGAGGRGGTFATHG
jgi:hypothetical protein